MKKTVVVLGFIISFVLIGLGVYGLILSNEENTSINKEETNMLDGLKNSFEAIKNINNFSYEYNITTNKGEKVSGFLKVDLDTRQSEKLIKENGIQERHSYIVLENGTWVNYLSLGDEDFKKNPDENGAYVILDTPIDEVFLNNINLFEEKENDTFVAMIPKEVASSFLEDEEIEVIGDIQVVVTLNGNYVEKIIYDCSNVIKSGEEVYTSYVITEKYYDIGSTVINVPDEVKNNAIQS